MKVLLLNGSPHEYGCTYTALKEAANSLHSHGVETELIWIGTKPISGCIGCGKCGNAGMCVFNDQVNEIHKRMDEFQGLIIGSPVYYGGPSGQIKCFLDRLFQSSLFEWKGKLGAAVVSCRRGGASMAFQSLNMYFTISNMQVVGSQYWNQVHGFTPEDVKMDEEGLQTMRILGQNMAWQLKNMESGKKEGIKLSEYEERMWTHFIR
ncbi:MAG: flavodoxin family protein [Bacillus sp. (in: Bacteria)]|nr:flavodoxin family protein [Bacillus sp. (in: firmicutes)]MCM1425876.1 flavodoxin family protein [Eubacterium sp.]